MDTTIIAYTGYTKAIDQDEVVRWFAAKQGHPPFEVVDGGSVWLAGPIGAKSPDDLRINRVQSVHPMTPEQAQQLIMKFGGEQ